MFMGKKNVDSGVQGGVGMSGGVFVRLGGAERLVSERGSSSRFELCV